MQEYYSSYGTCSKIESILLYWYMQLGSMGGNLDDLCYNEAHLGQYIFPTVGGQGGFHRYACRCNSKYRDESKVYYCQSMNGCRINNK